MKKLESMSSDIDQRKDKSVPKSTFSGLFQGNEDAPRGSKRSAILSGNCDPSNATAVNNDLVAVKPLKRLYVSMLHPDTTEDSVMKLLSNVLKIAKTEFKYVKLLPKINRHRPTSHLNWECPMAC
jgi:hypothetical protein